MIYTLMIKILFLIGLGILATRLKWIDQAGRKSMSELLVNVILPISMLASSQDIFVKENVKGLVVIAVIAFSYYVFIFVMGKMLGYIFHLEYDARVITTLLIGFANTGFVGMPLVRELTGATGLLYGTIYNVVFDLLYFSYGLSLLQKDGKDKKRKNMFANPIIWISIGSVILYLLPCRLPMVITESLEMVSGTMMPISMLIIGSQICSMKLGEVLKHKLAYGITLIRMLVIPFITFAILYGLCVDSSVACVALILSAMPSASLNVIMAEKYKKKPELAAVVVMQNTIIMIVTLPLFMYLSKFF